MRKSRFTNAQIIGVIKKQVAGFPAAELHCLRAMALAGASFNVTRRSDSKKPRTGAAHVFNNATRFWLRGQDLAYTEHRFTCCHLLH